MIVFVTFLDSFLNPFMEEWHTGEIHVANVCVVSLPSPLIRMSVSCDSVHTLNFTQPIITHQVEGRPTVTPTCTTVED